MIIRVLMFGPAQEMFGAESVDVELAPGATAGDLGAALEREHSQAWTNLAGARIAVNAEFAGKEHILHPGDEVAVIPPVSGGANPVRVDLTRQPIDVRALQRWIDDHADGQCGAVCTFVGKTRSEMHPTHGPLLNLEYKAYESMACKQMDALIAQAMDRWSIHAAALVHRLGAVPIGEASVLIAVAGGHRDEAFQSCRWLIDALKSQLPIWKREVWQSGVSTWSQPERSSKPT